ncbi:T9SS type A sorting domain-containing protein [Chryseobacterium sp. SC28]|uniref:T9SS type A sorting domain-containing protein n=1 Tax=Chryseobacterium sp. SC28 TaxID=2268028 RepID=UPI000F6477D7|nr:T9SS type A sorting domain-containing protein [Chryseobacterium sp. SC28]RRQ46856.1 T9SS C-terminal target domain-containing protein [Chryseobacterium sp. SC28]
MKKFYSLIAAVALTATVNAQTTVVNETFTFTGALNANGWTTHSGTAGQLQSNGSQAVLVAGNSEDVNKAFSTSYPLTNKAEYSATINVSTATGLSTSGDYFLMFGGTAGTTVTTFYGRLYIKGSATGYTLGILNNSGGTATPTYGTEIAYGTPANILVTYNAANIATLKIDGQPLLINSTGTSAVATNLASIAIRQAGNATSGTGAVSIDDLIARTYTGTLSVLDPSKTKANLVKNTIVGNEIIFGAAANVSIYNAAGQMVKTAEVSENSRLDVSALPKGNYIVTGLVKGQAVSQKIIKK